MTQTALEKSIEEQVLQCDVALLNEHGVGDDTIKTMAAEHAARSATLAKMIEPTMGRAFLLVAAGVLMNAAKDIDANTFQEPELVSVG